MAYKAYIFDIGNVLIHFSFEKMVQQMCGLYGAAFDEMVAVIGKLGRLYERGTISTEELFTSLEQTFDRRPPDTAVERALSDIFTENCEMSGMPARLRASGARTVLLSNTNDIHWRYIEQRYPFLRDFDATVLSFREGTAKPEQVIYEAALRAADCAPKECLFIDDLEENVVAARKLGMNAVVYGNLVSARDIFDNHTVAMADPVADR